MEQATTAKVKIADSSDILSDSIETYGEAVQYCITKGWNEASSRRDLHDMTYYDVRERFGLYADLTTHVISQAWEMMKDSRTKPEVKNPCIRYNFPRSASIKGDWETLSIQTTDGRMEFPLNIPGCFEKYLDWDVCESTLIRDEKGRFFMCFTFSQEVAIEVGGGSQVLGVDLGINKTAVTSDNRFLGTRVREHRNRWEHLRSELQRKGTHATHKRLESMGKRFNRYMTWENHNISKEILEPLSEGDVLVMEDLSGIRETSGNEWIHKWSFHQLQSFLEYKATLKGVRVVYIDPRNTSKTCSQCGSLDTFRSGGWFECHRCGFTLDADLNAARNIADSYMETLGKRVAPVSLPNDSGNDERECPCVAA